MGIDQRTGTSLYLGVGERMRVGVSGAMLKNGKPELSKEDWGGGGEDIERAKAFLLLTWTISTILALRLHIVHSCRWRKERWINNNMHHGKIHTHKYTSHAPNVWKMNREKQREGIFEAHGMMRGEMIWAWFHARLPSIETTSVGEKFIISRRGFFFINSLCRAEG